MKWSVGGTNTDAVKLYSDTECKNEVGTAATETLTVYVKGIKAGSTTVTATSNADSEKTASYNVTVNAAAAHTHDFTYNANGATITASCSADGCTLPPSTEGGTNHVATLTITAPTLTTYGQTGTGISAEATITDANSIQGDAKVQYQTKNNGSYGTASETAPTGVGDHKASITLGSATVFVEYTIAKAAAPDAGTLTNAQKPTAKTGNDVIYTGSPLALVTAPTSLPENYTGVQYSTDNGQT